MTKEEQIFLLHRAQAQCEKRLKEVLQKPGGGGAGGGSGGQGQETQRGQRKVGAQEAKAGGTKGGRAQVKGARPQ